MPAYALVIAKADGQQHTTLCNFPNDQSALRDTGMFLSTEHSSLALARNPGSAFYFTGARDGHDGAAIWIAEE